MVELGGMVAADSRFYACAAEMAATLLWRRPTGNADLGELELVRQALVGNDLNFKAALRRTTQLPTYRAGAPGPAMSDEEAETERFRRLVSPAQLSSVVADLTGFEWVLDTCDQLDNDDFGYRTLAGGVDGANVTTPQQDPSLTWALVHKRLAEGTAIHVVSEELEGSGERKLLQSVTLDQRPGDAVFEAELEHLHKRMFSTDLSTEERDAWVALWQLAETDHGAAVAWMTLLSAILRDPEFVSY
jgi:hypothetical protein